MTAFRRKFLSSCATVIILCIMALSCNRSQLITTLPPPPVNPCDAAMALSWDTLQMIIQEKGKIVVDIYPVKYSPDPAVCKVDLVTYLRNKEGTPIPRPGDLSDKEFKQVAKNFIAFLKNNHVPREQIVMGYQLALDESTKAKLDHIWFLYRTHRFELLFPNGLPKYDTCRVPPDCKIPMGQMSGMQAAIDEVYNQAKN